MSSAGSTARGCRRCDRRAARCTRAHRCGGGAAARGRWVGGVGGCGVRPRAVAAAANGGGAVGGARSGGPGAGGACFDGAAALCILGWPPRARRVGACARVGAAVCILLRRGSVVAATGRPPHLAPADEPRAAADRCRSQAWAATDAAAVAHARRRPVTRRHAGAPAHWLCSGALLPRVGCRLAARSCAGAPPPCAPPPVRSVGRAAARHLIAIVAGSAATRRSAHARTFGAWRVARRPTGARGSSGGGGARSGRRRQRGLAAPGRRGRRHAAPPPPSRTTVRRGVRRCPAGTSSPCREPSPAAPPPHSIGRRRAAPQTRGLPSNRSSSPPPPPPQQSSTARASVRRRGRRGGGARPSCRCAAQLT